MAQSGVQEKPPSNGVAAKAQPTRNLFEELPGEIRNTIYWYYCESTEIKIRLTILDNLPASRVTGCLAIWEQELHLSPLTQTSRRIRIEFFEYALSRLPLVIAIQPSLWPWPAGVPEDWLRLLLPEDFAERVKHVAIINAGYLTSLQFASVLTTKDDWFPSLSSIAVRDCPDSLASYFACQDWPACGTVSTSAKRSGPDTLGSDLAEEESGPLVSCRSWYEFSSSAQEAYCIMVSKYLGFKGTWTVVS